MAKPGNKAAARLERRQAGYTASKRGDTKRAGSLNPHKSSPNGSGQRSKQKVRADSRTATSS